MFGQSDVWNRYFSDFVNYKLNLSRHGNVEGVCLPHEDISQRLLHTYFGQLHDMDPPKRLSLLHCYVRVNQLQLAQMATLLRPLSKIKEVSTARLCCTHTLIHIHIHAHAHTHTHTHACTDAHVFPTDVPSVFAIYFS